MRNGQGPVDLGKAPELGLRAPAGLAVKGFVLRELGMANLVVCYY